MQIRTRLTIQFSIINGTIFLLALIIIYFMFKHYVEDEFYSILESKARMTGQLVLSRENDLKPIEFSNAQMSTEPISLPSIDNVSIYNNALQVVFTIQPTKLPSIDKEDLQKTLLMGKSRLIRGGKKILCTSITSSTGRPFVVVVEGRMSDTRLQTLRNLMLFSFLFVVLITIGGGWFYAGEALQPIRKIVDEVDSILPKDLSKRLIDTNSKDELADLITTFNRLLDRIQHAFRLQRSFISHVSHELRNPLTALDAQLQLAMNRQLNIEDYQKLLSSLSDDVHELISMSEKLLQLAKVNSEGFGITLARCRLDELIFQAKDLLPKANGSYIAILKIDELPDDEEALYIHCDEQLLRIALLNLLENGCKFSPNHRVEVNMFFKASGNHIISIYNEGEGIAEEYRQTIFQPFYRISNHHSNTKGSGIGLSLVQTIMQLHKIEIAVDSKPQKGVTFVLTFPPKV